MRMHLSKLIAITLAGLFCGCIVRTGVRPAPPPGQPGVQRMTYQEAVSRAEEYANSRGYAVRHVGNAELTGHDVWKVKVDVEKPGARGKIHMEFDAWSRNLLRADEKVHPGGPYANGRYDEDDDDRGEHGEHGEHGHGHEHRASAANDDD